MATGGQSKRAILQRLHFGARVAEEEQQELVNYFVETDQWKRILTGGVDIVYGPKGSGKSAIYFGILNRQDELFDRGILVVAAENPTGAPAFKHLIDDPPTGENEFTFLWKLYFLSLIGRVFREYGIEDGPADLVLVHLERAGVLPMEASLRGVLSSVFGYVRNLFRVQSVETSIDIEPVSGLAKGFTGKITFREPTSESKVAGYIAIDELFELANQALTNHDLTVWLVIDRLDVAFAEQPALERNALRALFRVYADFRSYSSIWLKVFMRSDLWRRITEGGFREASHITRNITITWDRASLLNLVIRRVLENPELREFYGVQKQEVLSDIERQQDLFYRIFPRQVDTGPNKPDTFGWMLSRTRDGTNTNAPRELIHLLTSAREQQLRKLEIGDEQPSGEELFSRSAVKDALPEVSRVRLEQTLYAEFPHLKPFLEKLESQKTEQTLESLANIWGLAPEQATQTATELVEAGFFERRGEKSEPSFWVPFLYRDGLKMVQGRVDD